MLKKKISALLAGVCMLTSSIIPVQVAVAGTCGEWVVRCHPGSITVNGVGIDTAKVYVKKDNDDSTTYTMTYSYGEFRYELPDGHYRAVDFHDYLTNQYGFFNSEFDVIDGVIYESDPVATTTFESTKKKMALRASGMSADEVTEQKIDEVSQEPIFTADVALTAEKVAPGKTLKVESSITVNTRIKAIVEVNIVQPDLTKVKAGEVIHSFKEGKPKTITIPYTVPQDAVAGTYKVEVSILHPDRSKTYLVNDDSQFAVEDGTAPHTYKSRMILEETTVHPGEVLGLTAEVTSPESAKRLIVVEINDPNGKRVEQFKHDSVKLKAGEPTLLPMKWNVPADAQKGTYSISIGVLGTKDKIYDWNDNGGKFTVTPIEDKFEPNNDSDRATTFTTDSLEATIHEATDVDYYRIEVEKLSDVDLTLSQIPTDTDYNLELLNESLQTVATASSTGTEDESITKRLEAGSYYLKVVSASGYSASNVYQLGKQITAVTSGNPFDKAIPIAMRSPVFGAIESTDQVNLYRLDIATAGSAVVLADTLPVDPSQSEPLPGKLYTFQLLDEEGKSIGNEFPGDPSHATVVGNVTPGTYYVRVTGTSLFDPRFRYKLVVDGSATSVVKDSFENNDKPDEAKQLDDTSVSANLHSTADIDYFTFDVSDRSNVIVTLTNIPTGQDYTLEILDSNLATVEQKTTSGNANENFQRILEAGKYYAKVTSASGASSTAFYNLRKYVLPPESTEVANGSLAKAIPLYLGHKVNGAIENVGEQNYYKLQIGKSGNLVINISTENSGMSSFAVMPGSLYQMALLDGNGSVLATSTSNSVDNSVIMSSVTPGLYYVLVEGTDVMNPLTKYRLIANGTTSTSGPDAYESNDQPTSATLFSDTELYANIHDSSDVDYYTFTLTEKSNVNLILSDIPAGADYNIQVLDANLNVIESTSMTGNTNETFTKKLSPGTYYVKVYPVTGYSDINPYKLSKTINKAIGLDLVAIPDDVVAKVVKGGNPVPDGAIFVKSASGEVTIGEVIRGVAVVKGLSQGTYDVVAYREPPHSKETRLNQSFTVSVDEKASIVVELPQENVKGLVSINGVNLSKGKIIFETGQWTAIENGSFSAYLPPGDYQNITILNTSTNMLDNISEVFTVEPNQTTELDIQLP
ncbi:pre-peptidase C-terminal domain-containing protein [Brevibacillus sp. SYSU BS000544]|uniref:pre-peptidase C-terminal domain-containing protein n=1 Tax=Brevibacillus sp. SYSU BS000544 TaxID=3416443 RepID=UPI003CE49F57